MSPLRLAGIRQGGEASPTSPSPGYAREYNQQYQEGAAAGGRRTASPRSGMSSRSAGSTGSARFNGNMMQKLYSPRAVEELPRMLEDRNGAASVAAMRRGLSACPVRTGGFQYVDLSDMPLSHSKTAFRSAGHDALFTFEDDSSTWRRGTYFGSKAHNSHGGKGSRRGRRGSPRS